MDRIAVAVTWFRELVGSVAPYVFLEVVMPGGTLLALLLYLHRHRIRARDTAFGAPPPAVRYRCERGREHYYRPDLG